MNGSVRRSPFLAVSGVYIGQSLLGGLTFQAVPALLRTTGASLAVTGLMGLAMVPWALKFLWAPMIERYRRPAGRARRSKLVLGSGQAVVVICLAGIAINGRYAPLALLCLLLIAATASATADIAVDAYCIEQVAERQRGTAAAVQIGASYVGMVAGAGGLLLLAGRLGWSSAFLGAALCIALMGLPFLTRAETGSGDGGEHAHRPSLAYALRKQEVRTGIVVTALFQAGMRLAQGLSGPMLVDAGFDLSMLGLLGILAAAAGLAGSWAGGLAIRWMGGQRALLLAASGQLAALLCWAGGAAAGTSGLMLPPLFLAFGFIAAFGFVVLYARLMAWSSLLQIGVDYTIFQCVDGLVAAAMAIGGGLIAASLGYLGGFLAGCSLSLIAVVTLPFLISRATDEAHA